MDIETASAIKLFFPNPSLRLVLFEALANSLDAGASEVSVEISVDSFERPETLEFTITDNGAGFTDENFARFKTLLKPRDEFHKGIGRLVFLNYFDRVDVNSTWGNQQRKFTFREGFDGHAPIEAVQSTKFPSTVLKFSGFSGERVRAYDDLKPAPLKEQMIQHFLPTLSAMKREGKGFIIVVDLKTEEENTQKDFFSSKETITSADLPEMKHVYVKEDSLDAHLSIDIYYHVTQVQGKGSSLIAFSIDGRTIPATIVSPSSIPMGYRCVVLIESDLFHSNADSSRQKLVLPNGTQEAELYRLLRREIGKILAGCIPQITQKNEKTKSQFEEKYPHLLGYFENDSVGLIDKDDALAIAQQQFFKDQKLVLQCEVISEKLYEKSLELSSRALTEYILYRDKIIGRLKAMTSDNSEAEIHNLIVPRYEEFCQDKLPADVYRNNAWLLDDKFMAFRTILSESEMESVISAIRLNDEKVGVSGRPDITMIFSADPKESKTVDVVVVEIKKKTDDEKDNQYAINQLLDRAVKLVEHCPNIQRVWYYAVIQISDTMSTRLKQQKWSPLFSKGRVFYQEFPTERPDGTIVPTPTFVMSFDAIVADAECRNHTFLEILRSGMKRFADNRDEAGETEYTLDSDISSTLLVLQEHESTFEIVSEN